MCGQDVETMPVNRSLLETLVEIAASASRLVLAANGRPFRGSYPLGDEDPRDPAQREPGRGQLGDPDERRGLLGIGHQPPARTFE